MAKRVRLSKGALGVKAKFDEAKHKRDSEGKFADKPGAGDDAPKKQRAKKNFLVSPTGEKFGTPGGPSGPPAAQSTFGKLASLAGGSSSVGKYSFSTSGFVAPKGDKLTLLKVGGKTSGIKGHDVLKIHVGANPKKAGTASWERFEQYRDGMTVDEYAEAVVKIGQPKKKALEDVAWDRKHGFLSAHDKSQIAALDAYDKEQDVFEKSIIHSKLTKEWTKKQNDVEVPKAAAAKAATPPPAPDAYKPPSKKVDTIEASDYLVLSPEANPYAYGSPEYMKFKAISLSGGKMTMINFMATKSLDTAGKKAALQKLIDNGHVTVSSAPQQSAIQAAKDQSPIQVKKVETLDLAPSPPMPGAVWEKALGVKKYGVALNDVWDDNKAQIDLARAEAMKAVKSSGVKIYSAHSNDTVDFYTGHGYSDLNRALRGKPGAVMTDYLKKRTRELDTLVNGSTFETDVIMWRGISTHVGSANAAKFNANDIPPPQDFGDAAFSSVSFSPVVAKGFSGTAKGEISGVTVKTLFRIRVPKGSRGAMVGRHSDDPSDILSDEAEVVMPRGTRYKYVTHSFVGSGSGKIKIIDVEVDQSDSPMTGMGIPPVAGTEKPKVPLDIQF